MHWQTACPKLGLRMKTYTSLKLSPRIPPDICHLALPVVLPTGSDPLDGTRYGYGDDKVSQGLDG